LQVTRANRKENRHVPQANIPSQLQLWKERLEQFSQSGQSVQKYCDSAGCTPASFYYWKRKVTTASQSGVSLPAKQGSAFVPVVVRDNRSSRVLVCVKDGTRIAVPADALGALQAVLQHAQRVAG
jgi:hypothetical protein